MSLREDLGSSVALRAAGRRALELAGTDVDDVAHLDLYACFPSAVQLAARELGIDLSRQLSVFGGLSFGGGPWNNPVGHSLACMVDTLREDPGSLGLVTANGGMVDKHSMGVLGTDPPADGFRHDRPQAQVDSAAERRVVTEHRGSVTVEAWTVMADRDGSWSRGHAACLTPDGARAWGVTTDPDTMAEMASGDLGGRPAHLGADAVLSLG